jgi:hypothetical protein
MSGSESGQYSGHATSVGKTFYGNPSSIAPGPTAVEAYWADDWLQGGYLRYGSVYKPLASASRIANHSRIAEVPAPNGGMDTGDLLLIQRKVPGLAAF